MTSLKTKNICFLAAFLFLAIVPTLAEVVKEVKDCKQFLHDETPPNIPGILVGGNIQDNNRYKVICQTYGNKPWYLTVYDTRNKIPVFSAYEYKGSVEGDRFKTWMIEPQLEENMMTEKMSCTNQAMGVDYEQDKSYSRGHFFPASHASSPEQRISTFTLTNAAPQKKIFNEGKWADKENKFRDLMKERINDQTRCFVVVGAQHGQVYLNGPPEKPKLRMVNVPRIMWSAFYCTDHMSGAFWGINEDNSDVHEGTLQQLQDELDDLTIDPTLKGITVFPQKQPALKRSSSDSQQPQAGRSNQPQRSKSLPSSAGKP